MALRPIRDSRAAGVAAALVLSLAVVGCSNDSADPDRPSGPATTVGADDIAEVTLDDYRFSPATLDVGTARHVRVKNLGGLEHTWTVLGSAIGTEADLVGAEVLVEARVEVGQSTLVDIGSLEPGRYQIACAIAGHISAGMVGELVVGEAGD